MRIKTENPEQREALQYCANAYPVIRKEIPRRIRELIGQPQEISGGLRPL
jgi:hypothetical protein